MATTAAQTKEHEEDEHAEIRQEKRRKTGRKRHKERQEIVLKAFIV